jgi:hypothetical protein
MDNLISAVTIQPQRAMSATALLTKPLNLQALEGFLQRLH